MSTQTPETKKDKIKRLRRELAPLLKDVQTAEAVLLAAQQAASPHVAALLQASGMPQHKITLDKGTETETKVIANFRKIGDYAGEGGKVAPLYGVKILDMADEDED